VLTELDLFFSDDRNAWLLRPDGSYVRAETEQGLSAQQHLMDHADQSPIFGEARRSERTQPPPAASSSRSASDQPR